MKALIVVLALWLGGGIYGVVAYGHDYYVYRGFPPPRDPSGVTAGRLVQVHFFSRALGKRDSYRVYLPPGYDRAAAAGTRYPVLYLLHGAPGWARLFTDAGHLGVAMDTLVVRRRIRPFLVVLPDGPSGTFHTDTEWANTPRGRYEGFVLDVVRAVDGRYPTLAARRFRGIGGNSEGAFASVNISLHHLRTFAFAQSWSGYFTQTRSGPFKHASDAAIRANSPVAYVGSMRAALRRHHLRAFLYSGVRDHHRAEIAAFSRELRRAGAEVRFALYPGRHEWRLWRSQTPNMLEVADQWFGPRP